MPFLLALHFHQLVLMNDKKMCLGYFSLCPREEFSQISDANFSMFSWNFLLLKREETSCNFKICTTWGSPSEKHVSWPSSAKMSHSHLSNLYQTRRINSPECTKQWGKSKQGLESSLLLWFSSHFTVTELWSQYDSSTNTEKGKFTYFVGRYEN